MSTQLWAIIAIQQIITATGYRIVVTTDVPCHLYMRWTTVFPKQHMIPILRRGIYIHSDKYFCFDVYDDNEQEEPGDTLIHTFIKEPWPECETRYFYFHGSIAGVASPSTSPIFTKHRTLDPYGPPVWITCYLHGLPGWFIAHDPDWSDVQTKDPYHHALHTLPEDGTHFTGAEYYIKRAATAWDTSAIPIGALVVNALFHVYGRFNPWGTPPSNSYTDMLLNFAAWNGSNAASWYAYMNLLLGICCQIDVDTSWLDAWRNHPLTSFGLTKIVPAGITKYCHTTDKDLFNQNPGAGRRGYQWRQPVGFDPPTLHVQYRPLL